MGTRRVQGWGGRGAAVILVAVAVGCSGTGDYTPMPTPTATGATPAPTPTATFPPDAYVLNDEGTGAFPSLQAAVEGVPGGATLILLPGTYREAVTVDDTRVTVRGWGPDAHAVVIDASGCTSSRCGALNVLGQADLTVEGLTLTGGRGSTCAVNGAPSSSGGRCGGAVFVHDAHLTATGLWVTGTTADRGGGVFLGPGAVGTLSRVEISGTTADRGGALAVQGGALVGDHLRLWGNEASEQGGALDLSQDGQASLRWVALTGNRALVGGAIAAGVGTLDLEHVVLDTNAASLLGGGLSVTEGAQVSVVSSILSNNTADQGPAANLSCAACTLDLDWTNVYPLMGRWGGSTEQVQEGQGVLGLPPGYLAAGDLRLAATSDCVDAGPPDELDPDGGRADLGIYGGAGASTWDQDGDGVVGAWMPGGVSLGGEDCDDLAADVAPGAPERCDGADNNCDGEVPADEADGDGDGWRACGAGDDPQPDCDDTQAEAHPDGDEAANNGDGINNDCDEDVDEGTRGADDDGDGYCEGAPTDGDPVCTTGDALPGDCDDTDGARAPGRGERCNGLDDDCDGILPEDEEDRDLDGFPSCDPNAEDGPAGGDPDDGNNLIYPGASETPNGLPDGLDNDGDGEVDEGTEIADDDGDGYCEGPARCIDDLPGGDCDDGAACDPADESCLDVARAVHPSAEEVCNGYDDDCDGVGLTGEADEDGDGYLGCEAVDRGADCDDQREDVHPGALDVERNGLDEDCNGLDRGAVGFAAPGEAEPPSALVLSCDVGAASGPPPPAWLLGLLLVASRRRR